MEDMLAMCQAVVGDADSAKPPHLPLSVVIGGQRLNAAEFLLVMAHAYRALAQGQSSERVEVNPAEVTPPYGDLVQTLFHPAEENPLWYSKLQLWTVKPARLRWSMVGLEVGPEASPEAGPEAGPEASPEASPE